MYILYLSSIFINNFLQIQKLKSASFKRYSVKNKKKFKTSQNKIVLKQKKLYKYLKYVYCSTDIKMKK